MSIYDFTVKTNRGEEKSLADYKGKVVLIVNTASKCGFTPQFEGLEALYKKYKEQGLEVLGFPCNQFLDQDPGTAGEIEQFCRLNYGVSFQLFEKGDVRGENAQPLFQYLTKEKGFKGLDLAHKNGKVLQGVLEEKFPAWLKDDGIKWNFTKFLVDREGNVVERYEPTTEPKDIAGAIEKLL